ncbi:MAG: ketopantoate reductase family protein [Chloroflexota bacterium]
MRIGVIGAGSMGSVYGGRLAASGNEVWFVDIWQEHVDALNRDGLRLIDATSERVIPAKATTDPGTVEPVDLAIVFVKSPDTAAAVRAALPMAGPETLFLTLQNGMGNRETIAALMGEERVLAGICYVGANLLGPGVVRHTSNAGTLIGEADGYRSARVEKIVGLLNEAGLPAKVSDNIMGEIWGKLIINAIGNASCALTGSLVDDLVKYDCGRQWMRLVADEAEAVARAAGMILPYANAYAKMYANCKVAGPAKPSMMQDVEKGRWTEVDYINGAIVREGERLGIPTPYNRALTLLTKMVEARQHGEERVWQP